MTFFSFKKWIKSALKKRFWRKKVQGSVQRTFLWFYNHKKMIKKNVSPPKKSSCGPPFEKIPLFWQKVKNRPSLQGRPPRPWGSFFIFPNHLLKLGHFFSALRAKKFLRNFFAQTRFARMGGWLKCFAKKQWSPEGLRRFWPAASLGGASAHKAAGQNHP